MSEMIRPLLLLALAGSLVTLAGSGLAWWLDEERKLRRLIRRCLGGPPDAEVVVKGRNAAAGFRLDEDRVIVMWNGGAKALLYPLRALEGAELVVDDTVVGRVYRGEPRRALDAVKAGAGRVTLRLIFDNPRDPDFQLDLWAPGDEQRRESGSPADAIHEGRTWLARAEAILRRPVARTPEPWEEDEGEPDSDEDPVQSA